MSLKIFLLVAFVGITAAASIEGEKAADGKAEIEQAGDHAEQSRVVRQLPRYVGSDNFGSGAGSLDGNVGMGVGFVPQYAQQSYGGFDGSQSSVNSGLQSVGDRRDFSINPRAGIYMTADGRYVIRSSSQDIPNWNAFQSAAPVESGYYLSQLAQQAEANYLSMQPAGSQANFMPSQMSSQAAPGYMAVQAGVPAQANSFPSQQSASAIPSPRARPVNNIPNQQGGSAMSNQPIQPVNNIPNQLGGSAMSNQPIQPVNNIPNQLGGSAMSNQPIQLVNNIPNQLGGSAMSNQPIQPVNNIPNQLGGSGMPRQRVVPANNSPGQQGGPAISSQSVPPANNVPSQQAGAPSQSAGSAYNSVGQQDGSVIPNQPSSVSLGYSTYSETAPVELQPNCAGREIHVPSSPYASLTFSPGSSFWRSGSSRGGFASRFPNARPLLLRKLSEILGAVHKAQSQRH